MHSAASPLYFSRPDSHDSAGLSSQHTLMSEESPHRVDTVLWLRKQLSEKDVEIMQVAAAAHPGLA